MVKITILTNKVQKILKLIRINQNYINKNAIDFYLVSKGQDSQFFIKFFCIRMKKKTNKERC